MADISLQDYLDKLDGLLSDAATDEVIHHCRHILQYFPKNVAAFRLLGRALVYSGRWKEAGEVFRRVLSVAPDDYLAHASLGEVYRRSNNPDRAIWHLERAFDQDPNSQDVVKRLRELYQQHRQMDQAKIQLTTGAVARHYAKNGLYEQAVDTLQEALERTPERVDLRLLMAQMLWQSDRRLEAAEVALDVLQMLPDCLAANQMMTELWLSEGRPSDAQRHLNRIEAVDPYAAYQLAKGESAPEDAFHLEELDYQRVARHQLVTQRPDWLQEIGETEGQTSASGTDDWMNKLGGDSAVVEETEAPAFDANSGFSSTPPEDWMSEITAMQDAAADDTLAAKPEKPASGEPSGFTGLLAALGSPTSDASVEQQPSFEEDFLGAEEEELPSEDAFLSQEILPDEVPLSAESVASAQQPDVPDWFEEMAPEVERPSPTPAPVSSQDDPLAWLRGSGVEVVEGAEPGAQDPYGADEEMALPDASATDPLAWLQGRDEGALIEEEVGAATDSDKGDPLAWLHGSGVEVIEEDQPAGAQDEKITTGVLETAGDQSAEVQPSEDDMNALDWLSDEALLAEALDVEMLTSSRGSDDMPDDKLPPSDAESGASTPDAEEFDWLNDEEAQPAAEVPDWLQAMQPSETPASHEPQFEEPVGETEGETGFGAEDMPEWVSQMEAGEDQPEPAMEMGEQSADFSWAMEEDPPAQPASEVPDWLSALTPVTDEQPAEPAMESADQSSQFDWMAEEEEDVQPAAETPDWLSAVAPMASDEAEPTMESADQGSQFDWMVEEEEEAQPAAEAPDWLSAVAPVTSEQAEPGLDIAEEASEFDWVGAEEEEAQPAAEIPDWLSAIGPAVVQQEEPAVVSEADEVAASIDEEPAVESAADWLSQIQPSQAEQPVASVETEAASSEFSWLQHIQESAEEPEADQALDWMAEAEPEPAMEMASDVEMNETESAPAPAENAPDWLNAMVPGLDLDYEASEDSPIEQEYIEGVTHRVQSDVSAEPTEAQQEFDWLVEIVDEETSQVQAVQPRFIFSRQPVWLRNRNAVPAAQGYDDDPEWLREVDEPANNESEADDFDLPPWLR